MSVPLPMLQGVPRRVLASGGPGKIEAIIGAMKLMKPTVFING